MSYKRSFTVCLLLSFVLFIAFILGWSNVINLNETQYKIYLIIFQHSQQNQIIHLHI